MSDIHSITSQLTIPALRKTAEAPSRQHGQSPGGEQADTVEISETALFLSRVANMPDVRVSKIAAIREAIRHGDYETPEKIDKTIERLWLDL